MAHLHLQNVCVEYPIFNSVARSFRHTLFKTVGGVVAAHNKVVTVSALNNISIELNEGDRFGIIGHNFDLH